MLQVQRNPITEEEASRIKGFLLSGTAQRLRQLMIAEMAAEQARAVVAMSDLKDFPNKKADIDQAIERVALLRSVVATLDDFTNNPSQLADTEVKVGIGQS